MFVIQDGFVGPFVGHGNRWATDKDSIRQFATRQEAEMFLNQEVPFVMLVQVNTGMVIHEIPDEQEAVVEQEALPEVKEKKKRTRKPKVTDA